MFRYRTIRFKLVIENLKMFFENKIRLKHFPDTISFAGNVEISSEKFLVSKSFYKKFFFNFYFVKERNFNL